VNGTLQTINNITLDDVKQYYNAYLTPKGARMHVVGSVDKNRITQAVASLEQKWNKPAATLPSYALPKQDKGGKLYFVDFPGAKQSVIQAGKLALSAADEASNNLDFANEVLGVGSSGRLTQVLRIGKGYTYGAGSGIMKMKEVSPFFASTSVRANATLPSLEIIRNMLVDYGPKFTENEVEITKNKIIKRSSLQYESGFAKLAMLNDMSKYNKPVKYIEEDQQELIKMTLEDFKKVIARYLAEDEMIYIVVGDKATQFEEVKKLGKPVVELDYNGNPLKGF
jgi:zinc protease